MNKCQRRTDKGFVIVKKKANKPMWNLLGQKNSYLIVGVLHRRLMMIIISYNLD